LASNGDGQAVGRWQAAGIVPVDGGKGLLIILFHDKTGEISITQFPERKADPLVRPVTAIPRAN
jgi:hypothetical protein